MPDNQSQSALIQLAGLGRAFDTDAGRVHALKDVSLRISAGEFVCITGASGSGKSTLLNIVGCLDRPTEGSYRLAGRNVEGLGDGELARLRRLAFGFVFQDYGLLDDMTAVRNVELPAEYAGITAENRKRQAAELLRSFGLEDRQLHLPAEMSGGEQQRVAIARALMNGRQIILADEPTGALDSDQSAQILSLFKDLASHGNTVVMVSHDATVAAAADRRIQLLDGAIAHDSGAQRQTPEAVWSSPVTRKTKRTAWAAIIQAMRAGLESLRAAPLRTALLIGGPVLGVASVVALLGMANGTYQASLNVVGSMGADRVDIGVMPLPGVPSLNIDDGRSIEGIENVREVVLSQGDQKLVRRGDKVVTDVGVSGTQELPSFMKTLWPLAAGRYVTRQDGEALSQVVVIDDKLRDRIFAVGEEPLGEWIDIEGVAFEIIGVLAPHPIMQGELYTSRPPFPPMVWVPFATGREMLFGDEISMGVSAYVQDIARVEETASAIRDLLIRRRGHEDFQVVTDRQMFGVYRDSIRNRINVLVGIAVPALLLGAAVTMTLMLGGVRQRAREIAIRMAVGAWRGDILRQFIFETGAITLAGIAFGLPLGWLAGHAVNLFLEAPSAYEPWFIWTAAGSALAAGLLAGILPARRASRLDPVAALAAE